MSTSRTGRGNNKAAGRPPTPECGSCGRKLRPASVTEWKCGNPKCDAYNQKVNTGVYPT